MPFPDPPLYKAADIERRAGEFLREQLEDQIAIPVDVEYLLETIDGVVLDIIPSVKYGLRPQGAEGMVLRDVDSGELLVYVDEHLADTKPNRYRFTIAEELGHIILHRNVIDQINSNADFRELQSHDQWHRMDRNARRFAAAVLMPPSAVADEAQQVYKTIARRAFGAGADAVLGAMASEMARRFGVSPSAMKHRLTEWPMRIAERVSNAVSEHLDYLP